jgi:hypothetical protein
VFWEVKLSWQPSKDSYRARDSFHSGKRNCGAFFVALFAAACSLEPVPGACPWSLSLEPVPGACPWSLSLEPVPSDRGLFENQEVNTKIESGGIALHI